jgi:PiT family inorganic phosphate transporter
VATGIASEFGVTADSSGDNGNVVGVIAAMVAVGVCMTYRIPTSLTLALLGGLVGAQFSQGELQIGVGALAVALAICAFTPIMAAAVAAAAVRALAVALGTRHRIAVTQALHRTVFVGLALAYSLNDGQKNLAVLAMCTGLVTRRDSTVTLSPSEGLLVAGLFGLGLVLVTARRAPSLPSKIIPMRPLYGLTAELASAVAVVGSTVATTPVSATQSLAGGVVGAGAWTVRERWNIVGQLFVAWLGTLPIAFVVGAAIGTVG